MKKFILIFLFVGLFFIFPKKADAFFLTKNLVSKAVLSDGIKLSVCPIDLSLATSKPTTDLDSKVAKVFPILNNYPCKGSEQKFIFAQLSVSIPNSKKTANEFLYIFNDELIRSDNVGFSSEVPEGTDDFSWINKADFVYYRGLNKISIGDVNSKEPLPESELIMQNPNSAKTSFTDDQLTAIFNNVPVFDNAKKIDKDSSPLCSNSTNSLCVGNTQLFANDQNYDSLKSWYSGKLPNKNQACTFTETILGETKTRVSQLDYSTCMGDPEKNISVSLIETGDFTITVFDYTPVSGVFLLMYKGIPYRVSRVLGEVKDVVLIDNSSEKRDNSTISAPEKVVTEIGSFPQYNNADFVFKEVTPDCSSTKDAFGCKDNYYHWQTLDSFDGVWNFFKDQTKKDGWKCDFGTEPASQKQVMVGIFTCDKSDFHFWIYVFSDGTVTTIKLTVPKEALHLSTNNNPPPDSGANYPIIQAFPTYPGSTTKGVDPVSTKCLSDPNDLNCGVSSQVWETKDSFQKVLTWFKSYKFDSSWVCTWEDVGSSADNYARDDCTLNRGLMYFEIDDRQIVGEDKRIITVHVSTY